MPVNWLCSGPTLGSWHYFPSVYSSLCSQTTDPSCALRYSDIDYTCLPEKAFTCSSGFSVRQIIAEGMLMSLSFSVIVQCQLYIIFQICSEVLSIDVSRLRAYVITLLLHFNLFHNAWRLDLCYVTSFQFYLFSL